MITFLNFLWAQLAGPMPQGLSVRSQMKCSMKKKKSAKTSVPQECLPEEKINEMNKIKYKTTETNVRQYLLKNKKQI